MVFTAPGVCTRASYPSVPITSVPCGCGARLKNAGKSSRSHWSSMAENIEVGVVALFRKPRTSPIGVVRCIVRTKRIRIDRLRDVVAEHEIVFDLAQANLGEIRPEKNERGGIVERRRFQQLAEKNLTFLGGRHSGRRDFIPSILSANVKLAAAQRCARISITPRYGSASRRRGADGPSVIVGAAQFATRDEEGIGGRRGRATMRRQHCLPLRERVDRDEKREGLAVAPKSQDPSRAHGM